MTILDRSYAQHNWQSVQDKVVIPFFQAAKKIFVQAQSDAVNKFKPAGISLSGLIQRKQEAIPPNILKIYEKLLVKTTISTFLQQHLFPGAFFFNLQEN